MQYHYSILVRAKTKKNPPLSQLEWCRRGEKRENRKGKKKEMSPLPSHPARLIAQQRGGEATLHLISIYIIM